MNFVPGGKELEKLTPNRFAIPPAPVEMVTALAVAAVAENSVLEILRAVDENTCGFAPATAVLKVPTVAAAAAPDSAVDANRAPVSV